MGVRAPTPPLGAFPTTLKSGVRRKGERAAQLPESSQRNTRGTPSRRTPNHCSSSSVRGVHQGDPHKQHVWRRNRPRKGQKRQILSANYPDAHRDPQVQARSARAQAAGGAGHARGGGLGLGLIRGRAREGSGSEPGARPGEWAGSGAGARPEVGESGVGAGWGVWPGDAPGEAWSGSGQGESPVRALGLRRGARLVPGCSVPSGRGTPGSEPAASLLLAGNKPPLQPGRRLGQGHPTVRAPRAPPRPRIRAAPGPQFAPERPPSPPVCGAPRSPLARGTKEQLPRSGSRVCTDCPMALGPLSAAAAGLCVRAGGGKDGRGPQCASRGARTRKLSPAPVASTPPQSPSAGRPIH